MCSERNGEERNWERAEQVSGEALYGWRQWAIALALEHDVDVGEVDWLLQGVTPLTSTALKLDGYVNRVDIPLTVSLAALREQWRQRIDQRVPVQYLVGEVPWRNFMLTVSPDVLIPRPETELIVEVAGELVAQSPVAERLRVGPWADLGTGSGAIALGLAQQFPAATIHAVDISEEALAIAQLNAQQNYLAERIAFYQGSWLVPLSSLAGQLAGIVSNPPYIPSGTVLTLQPEVSHEPHLALDGGPDGLKSIRVLIETGAMYLVPGGIWLIELMAGQARTVADLLAQQGRYTEIASHSDLSGIQRFVSARKAL